MSPVLFTFQIILLILGFGVGYLFLIKAKTQENNLKTIGEILGWTLIVVTIILEILNFAYSITIVNNSIQKVYVPVNNANETQQQEIQEGNAPGIPAENTNPQASDVTQPNEVPQESGGKPIKRDIKDHE